MSLLEHDKVGNDVLDPRVNIPAYPTKLQAATDFMDLLQSTTEIESRLIIIVPDFRARIKDLTINGKDHICC